MPGEVMALLNAIDTSSPVLTPQKNAPNSSQRQYLRYRKRPAPCKSCSAWSDMVRRTREFLSFPPVTAVFDKHSSYRQRSHRS